MKMEAASSSETSVTSTVLYCATTQNTAIEDVCFQNRYWWRALMDVAVTFGFCRRRGILASEEGLLYVN
jgi:hypothetical protein